MGDLWTQGENIPAGWLLEWQRVGRGAPPDSPCYFFCDHPEVDILMVQGVHAAHDLQVLAGAAFMTLACAGFKAAPSLISMCIRQMWRKGSGLRPLPKVATKSSDGQE